MGEAKQRRLAKLAGKPWDVDKPKQAKVPHYTEEGLPRFKSKNRALGLSLLVAAIGGVGTLRRP